MKLWRLIPVVAFVGVLVAATVGLAAVQNVDDAHNFAAEGEQDARGCDGFEVEYGQDNGHVDRVKLHFAPGDTHAGPECEGEFVNVEVHGPNHQIMASCGPLQMTSTPFSCPISPAIPNEPCGGPICVKNIDHINLVVTDLN